MQYLPQFGQNIPNQVVGDQAPVDDATAQLLLKRRLAQADALRGQQMPQGQMVSGHYVAPSWTQYLANAIGQYQGIKKEKEAMKEYGGYQSEKQRKYAEALADYQNSLNPRTEQAPQQPTTVQGENGEIAPNMGMVNAPPRTLPATAADRYAALMKFAGATQNPELTQRAMLGNIEYANKQEDTASEREFQRIQQKDRQGFELTQGEKNFANQMALQKSNQQFQAGESAKNRANQIQLHSASQNAAPSGYKKNPDGSLTFIPGGPADPSTKPLTADQGNARLYGQRMGMSHKILNDLEAGDKLAYNPLKARLAITSPAGISDAISYYNDPQTQSATQAMRDFINATLRRESGAAISASEYDNAIKQYFPQPNESKEIREQKRRNREVAIQGISSAGYPGGVVPGQQSQAVNFGDLK